MMVATLIKHGLAIAFWVWLFALRTVIEITLGYVRRALPIDSISGGNSSSKKSFDEENRNYLTYSSSTPHGQQAECQGHHNAAMMQLRLRSSLKKRKELILKSRNKTVPSSMSCPTSPLTSPPRAVSPVQFQQRARTTSEMSEVDDQVMPLPDFRYRHRRWKSCNNVASNSSPASQSLRRMAIRHSSLVQLQQQQQELQQQQLGGAPAAGIKVRHASADEIDERKQKLLRDRRRQQQQQQYKRQPLQRSISLESVLFKQHQPHRLQQQQPPQQQQLQPVSRLSASSSLCNLASENGKASTTGRVTKVTKRENGDLVKTTYCIVSNDKSKFLVEQQVQVKSAQRGP